LTYFFLFYLNLK